MLHDGDRVGEAVEEPDEVLPGRVDDERPGEFVGVARRQALVAAFRGQLEEGRRSKTPVEVVVQEDLRGAEDRRRVIGAWSRHGQG